ncbi:hypothetical protein L227DRAFT_658702 [Lentinus tigrinus ALCF2SS1-6]|uniref:Yip1 domain-containing protein n=1 Tax=Lentinus tigrinus ALCF2SS1-6 TaxID=1328759 RepID=A0A5C2RM05_9APHY|nr:hypothetical protein L227DRAFT_658702 [Lentinus tigrinus ALCF2SS1-6]
MAACAAIILSGVPLVAVILTLIGCALADSAGIYKGLPVGRFCLAAIAMGLILGIIITVLACLYIQFLLGTKRLPWLRKRVPGVVGWGVACACVFALPAGLHAFRWFAAYRGHTGFLIIAAALGLVASAAPLCGLAYAVIGLYPNL